MVWLVLEWVRRWGRLPKLELGGLDSQAGEGGDDESGKLRDRVTREVVNREKEWVAKLREFEEELKGTIEFVRSALRSRPVGSTGQSASDQAMLAPVQSFRRRAEGVLESDRDKVEKREAKVREDTRRRIQWGVAAVGAASLLIACVGLFGAIAAIPDKGTLASPSVAAASVALSAIVVVVTVAVVLAWATHRSGDPNKTRRYFFYTGGTVAFLGGVFLIIVTFFEETWWTLAAALILMVGAAGCFLWPFETRLMPNDDVDAGHG